MPFNPYLRAEPFARGQVLALPSSIRGVYGIFNRPTYPVRPGFFEPATMLYVGKSNNDVRGRLLDHLSGIGGAPLLPVYTDGSTHFVIEFWQGGGLSGALAQSLRDSTLARREAELIAEYQPLCNTQGTGVALPDNTLADYLRRLGLL